MARALRLAARGIHAAHPNPMVGCVLVRDGVIVEDKKIEQVSVDHMRPSHRFINNIDLWNLLSFKL